MKNMSPSDHRIMRAHLCSAVSVSVTGRGDQEGLAEKALLNSIYNICWRVHLSAFFLSIRYIIKNIMNAGIKHTTTVNMKLLG